VRPSEGLLTEPTPAVWPSAAVQGTLSPERGQAVQPPITLAYHRISDPAARPGFRVLCPMNPAGERRLDRFGWTFAFGDKIMQIENEYDKDV
jgi:hypothetical protein